MPHKAGRHLRVVDNFRHPVESPLEERHVEIRAMHPDLRALQEIQERGEVLDAQRIDDGKLPGAAKLDQAELFLVRMKAVRLRVHRAPAARTGRRELGEKLGQGFRGFQDEATAVTRLRQAGAIILAKANMHEIALGITGQNIFTGDVCNPIDLARQAGGSSSGSAASIGAGIGWLSLGSDTAGSIRIPSANCGTVGFKPTHGVVPLQGALALCATCDHAGPIVRSVADAAIAYEILAQRPAPLDTSFTLSGLRLGHLRAYLEGCLGKRERVAFERLLMWLRDHGAQIVDVNPTDIELGPPAYTPLARAEAADVHRVALKVEPQNFSDIVRPALQNGATVTAMDYFDARRQREQVITGINDCLRSVDALIMPTTPVIAPLRGSTEVELESGTAQHRPAFLHLSIPYSFTGIPAISLPYAMVQGMPVSVQLASTPHAEIRVLNIGHALETALAHEPL